jgi:ribosome-associated translation inhibitor RaiA
MRLIGDFLFLFLFFVLIGVWLVMWIGFHIAGGMIHLPASREACGIRQCASDTENTMQIQINTDHNIEGHEALAAQVSEVVESALSLVSDHITRVEVHLSDENGDKRGQNDKRCMMEARMEGRQPVAVTHQSATLVQAVDGAADKLTRLIESTLGRRRHQESYRADPPLHRQKYAG